MSDEVESFRQSKFGARATFVMGADACDYEIRTNAENFGAAIPYRSLDFDNLSRFVITKTMATVGLFVAAMVFVVLAGSTVDEDFQQVFSFSFALAALTCFVLILTNPVTGWFSVRSTLIGLSPGKPGINRIAVLQGPQHDAIMVELKRRWRLAVRSRLEDGDIDHVLAGLPRRELDWLRGHEVINESEYKLAVDQLAETAAIPKRERNRLN